MAKSVRFYQIKAILSNLVFTVISLVIALLPFWVYLLMKYFLNPQGFLQNIFLIGVSMWFLGGLQLIFLIFWMVMILSLLSK